MTEHYANVENPDDRNSKRCSQDRSHGEKRDEGSCKLVAGLFAICV